MLACILKGQENIRLENLTIPAVGPGDVLIRMKACGICGTDLEKVSGELDPHGILGHEPCGIVERTGPGDHTLSIGDRVVVHHHVPCYNCNSCGAGDYTMCKMFKETNLDPCGMAEFFRVPAFNVSRGAVLGIPKSLDFEEGAMVEPTACCLRGIKKAKIRPDDDVVILGLGPTGLTQVQLVRQLTRGKVIGVDMIESRLKAATSFGADEQIDARSDNVTESIKEKTSGGADLAVVSTGNPRAFAQALCLVRKGGRILLFGAPGKNSSISLDLSFVFENQVQLLTSYSCLESEMKETIMLIESEKLNVKGLITDRFPLREAVQAFVSARASTSSLKTIIVS